MLTETLHTAFFYSGNKKTPVKLRFPTGPAAGEIAHFGRELCEDFAPRNEATRVSGERGAKRPARSPAKLHFSAERCVKILLPETKRQGLAGSGEQRDWTGRRRNCTFRPGVM